MRSFTVSLAFGLAAVSPFSERVGAQAKKKDVAVSAAAISANSQIVVAADDASVVRVLDLKSGKPIVALKAPTPDGAWWRTAVAASADARFVAYADGKAHITIWDLLEKGAPPIAFATASTRKVVAPYHVQVHTLAFLPDGKSLLVAGSDGSLQKWDLQTKTLAQTIAEGAENSIRTGKVKIVVDGVPREGTWQDPYGWASDAMAVTTDGKLAATTNGTDSIRLWSLKSGQCVRTLLFPSDDRSSRVATLSFSRDEKQLAAVIGNQFGGTRSYHADYVAVWDVATGALLHEAPPAKNDGTRDMRWLRDAQFDVSGKLLFTSDSTSAGGVWELSTGNKVARFDSSREFFVCADGDHVVVVTDRGLACRSVRTGKQIWRRDLVE